MFICFSDICGLDTSGTRAPGRSNVAGSAFAWSLLDYMLESFHGIGMPELAQTGEGKPYFPSRPDLCFSISHSRTHVLCALGERPVGADIETVRPLRPGLFERIASAQEREQFGFFELWTLRESFFKLTGSGSLMSMKFSRENERIISPSPAVCRVYRGIAGCVASVCAFEGPLPEALTEVGSEKLIKKQRV